MGGFLDIAYDESRELSDLVEDSLRLFLSPTRTTAVLPRILHQGPIIPLSEYYQCENYTLTSLVVKHYYLCKKGRRIKFQCITDLN